MLGMLFAGLLGKGAHSVYKEAKYQERVNTAGHQMLVGCNTIDEVIFEKCLWNTLSDMPKLTDEELRHIEWRYENRLPINPTISGGYRTQTGKDLREVVERRE